MKNKPIPSIADMKEKLKVTETPLDIQCRIEQSYIHSLGFTINDMERVMKDDLCTRELKLKLFEVIGKINECQELFNTMLEIKESGKYDEY